MDKNLEWLQNFICEVIQGNKVNVMDDLTDEQIIKDPYFNRLRYGSNLIYLSVLNNPGWGLNLNLQYSRYENLKHPTILIENKEKTENKFYNMFIVGSAKIESYNNLFDLFCPISCLCVCVEVARKFITEGVSTKIESFEDVDTIKNRIKGKNELLCWLDNFYLDSCEWDEEYCYSGISIKLLYTKSGWLISVYFDDYELYEDKEFAGKIVYEEGGVVNCYKKDRHFIIRAHTHGLITGLKIFREWADEVKSKYGALYDLT